MKKLFWVLMMVMTAQTAASAETYSIDPETSGIKWHASKVTGEHNGSVDIDSGVIEFEGSRFVGGEAVIDMTSITVEDIKDPGNNQKLTNHLKSADFFHVEEYPEAVIHVTEAVPAGENVYDVTADLTIKGITHPVTFPAEVVQTAEGVQAGADITLDRTLYDVRYGSGKFFEDLGDKMIHDEFHLAVSIQAEE